MGIKRSTLNALHAFAFIKSGLEYGYGGAFSRTNPQASTDCSGVVGAASMYLATGDDRNLYMRHGSTESWRLDPDGRYAGLIKVDHPSQIPADAVLRAGFQHGGGGEYSHTACTIEHANWESRGTPGVLYGSAARGWNDGLFHEFWYMPGPVDNDLPDHVYPLPAGFFYGPHEGPECSISGLAGEHRHWTDGLRRWQAAAGIVQDGVYGPATAQKARELQRLAGFPVVDGLVGPKTWELAVKSTNGGGPVPNPTDPLASMTPEQRILHELTYRFRTRVATSGYTDTLAGYVLQIDKASHEIKLEQERQGRILDAVATKVGVAA
ncbi:peptidoglycan-binding domain-containing protein [Rhodococcus maanshanensis]|uniref:peptidoglycan-binding domain-containing protein n=1 Tax=Rhodococcus maanshanensis TaxID=183556 RepID=UPI0022B5473C|nr:peptidoglycan-binding protein [Rhodococcus maanshanensis]MCZ4557992.1 peptidoglycan-binding domain-containing protein [Rhodococcus maanshanensis]